MFKCQYHKINNDEKWGLSLDVFKTIFKSNSLSKEDRDRFENIKPDFINFNRVYLNTEKYNIHSTHNFSENLCLFVDLESGCEIERPINIFDFMKVNDETSGVFMNDKAPMVILTDKNLDLFLSFHQFERVFSEKSCPICMEIFNNDSMTTICGHNFHQKCLDIHLKDCNTCPICIQEIKEKKKYPMIIEMPITTLVIIPIACVVFVIGTISYGIGHIVTKPFIKS